ncbi:hypothetical protein R3P38DRAFT_3183954 [Favolaschia claudopus]|uniref:F-box domain-containing protein n=1 Tax=Favolaschia claudopus TaxID=2862362 RepID=A0AAW0C914_9AGAR
MHRCLAIPEVLQLIFEGLNSGYDRDLPSLAVLAQTCRSFSPMALAQLWEILFGLDPVLHCMPLDLFSRRGKDSWKLQRAIRASDWERPLLYMGLIKDVIINPSPIVTTIFPALNASLPGEIETCFPRLSWVWWNHDSDLASMRLRYCCRRDSPGSPYLSRRPTRISRGCLPYPAYAPGYKKSVSSPGSLTVPPSQKVYIPDMPTLQHLSRLPSLTVMEISLPEFLLTTSSPLPFVSLKELKLRDSGGEESTNFFTICTMPALQDLDLPFEISTSIVAIDRLHTAVRDCCSHNSLKTFWVDYSECDLSEVSELEEPPNTCMLPFHSIQLLFCFTNLTTVSVRAHLGFRLNDEELKRIALAWPCLRVFCLQCGESAPYDAPGLTLRSLSTLAEYCISLYALTLSFDASTVPELSPITNGHQPTPQLALRQLYVDKSPISTPSVSVARFLFSLFPNLDAVYTFRAVGNDDEQTARGVRYSRLWRDVNSELSALKAVRKEGRTAAGWN